MRLRTISLSEIAVTIFLLQLLAMIGCSTAPKPKQNVRVKDKQERKEEDPHPEWTQTPDECEEARRIATEATKLPSPKDRIKRFEQALALCPKGYGFHFRLAVTLEEEQESPKNKKPDYSRVEAEYRETLRINPSHTGAIFHLAGIEYVMGRFDSAAVHYDKFLELEKENKKSKEMYLGAERMSIKCGWLAKLPPNSINLQSLRLDPDRYSGLNTLIGDIALELGKAATDVTGKIGYEAAGTGIWVGMQLLGKSEMNFDWGVKAIKKGDYTKLYMKSLENLPKAVNKKGIKSQEVSLLLMWTFVGGRNLQDKVRPSELAPFARALIHEIESSKDYLSPLMRSILEKSNITPSKEKWHDMLEGQWAYRLAQAYETLGDAATNNGDTRAFTFYKYAIDLINQTISLESADEAFYEVMPVSRLMNHKLVIRYKTASDNLKTPQLEANFLDSLINIYTE